MILIIGAGPVGCYVAALLAEDQKPKKHKIIVIEEHSSVGRPIQCTGIVTSQIYDFIPKNHNSIINKIRDVKIIASDNSFLKIRFKEPDVILDRESFDKFFYEKAEQKGVKFLFNHRFIKLRAGKAILKNIKTGKEKSVVYDYLVGADGPNSAVAKIINRKNKKNIFYIGMQAIVKKRNNNLIDFYPYKEGYAWAVPINKNYLRVGVSATTKTKSLFESLIKKYPGKILEKQGGLIPIYDPKLCLHKNNIFLIGDAATLVKATTGGGLISGLKSSKLLAKAIIENKNYETLIKKELHTDMMIHLKMRKIMDKFSEENWIELLKDFANPKLKKILSQVSRDKPFSLVSAVISKRPTILKHCIRNFKEVMFSWLI